MTISIASDTLVRLDGLIDQLTGFPVDNAAVTATVLDPNTGGTVIGPVTLTSAGVGGNYSGTLPEAQTSTLSAGGSYILQVQAVVPGGPTLTDRQTMQATYFSG